MMIEHANKWWTTIANAIEEGYIAIDEHDNIADYNASALRILQITDTQLNDADFWKYAWIQPLTLIIHQKREITGAEVYIEHEGGGSTWLRLNGKPLQADTDRGYLLTFTDITYWVETHHSLNRAISVFGQQKIRQLEEFNSIIAHNLRGPATLLIGSTDLLPEVNSEEDREVILAHMKTTAQSIIGTLNDLKEVIDLQVNTETPLTRCELESIILQVWSLLNPQIVDKDAQLQLNLTVPVVYFVKLYLENILFNLISNALTYTRPGIVPQIRVETWQEGDNVVLLVQDNGIGIDLERHREQLFCYKKKFHRGYESNGVGLFKIRNQICTLGGDIDVKSESGKGSSFYVYFNNRVHTLKQDE
jgi:PAS domain S-box-containing protein